MPMSGHIQTFFFPFDSFLFSILFFLMKDYFGTLMDLADFGLSDIKKKCCTVHIKCTILMKLLQCLVGVGIIPCGFFDIQGYQAFSLFLQKFCEMVTLISLKQTLKEYNFDFQQILQTLQSSHQNGNGSFGVPSCPVWPT